MKTMESVTTAENLNEATNAAQTATAYVAPVIEVIEMEMEGAILAGSAVGNDLNDGGYYDRYYGKN